MIGNGVATIVVARWEGELDVARLESELEGKPASDTRPASPQEIPVDEPASG